MVSVQARKEQAIHAIGRGLSQRRACTLLSISRSSLTYRHEMPIKDSPVIEAMKVLSAQYPRFGSRRIRIFLNRKGMPMGKERCARLWAEVKSKKCCKFPSIHPTESHFLITQFIEFEHI